MTAKIPRMEKKKKKKKKKERAHVGEAGLNLCMWCQAPSP
jgi:hypothetical protein